MNTLELFTQYQQALEEDTRAARRLVRASEERANAGRNREAAKLALERARDAFESAVKKETTQNEGTDQ